MPDDGSRHNVDVSGGKIGVIGDYATVFQSFADASRQVTSFVRTAQFQTLVNDRARNFVGREFVFEAVDRKLAGEEFASGYVVIKGEPGIGKTGVASALVLRGGYVHHFNIAPENIRSASQFLENVCAQLIIRYDLDHEQLPPDAGHDPGFLSQLLAEAVEEARHQKALPVVIVIDALDEAEDTGIPPEANRLYLPRTLPDGVFFVVTTREEVDYRLNVDNRAEIWIRDDDEANLNDVALYIGRFVEQHAQELGSVTRQWGLQNEEFVDEMLKRSEGNFMYLVYVLPEVARGRFARDGGDIDLPRGLMGYYQRHWREMKATDPKRFEQQQRPVLCFLAISREPVTIAQLMEWTGLDPGHVKGVIDEWREFLNEKHSSEGARYRIYHRSFADFLDEEENLRWYHDQIANAALAKIPGFLVS
jgi:hypothetical protein